MITLDKPLLLQDLPQTDETAPRTRATRGTRQWLALIILWMTLAWIALAAGIWGVRLRHWVFLQTDPIRFPWDIANGYNWGRHALKNGLVNTYNTLDDQQSGREHPDYGLDYPPLRLAVMRWWAGQVQKNLPQQADGWKNTWEFTRPVLHVNTACAAASALGAAVLVAIWRVRFLRRRRRTGALWQAPLLGFAAAMLLWLDPALIWNSHAWPQWDSWCLPFFIWACVAASLNSWFLCGLVTAVGILLKGQMALAAPIFPLWLIFSLNGWGLLRFFVGLALSAAICTSPWLLVSQPAWAVAIAATFVGLYIVIMQRKGRLGRQNVRQPLYIIAGFAALGMWMALFGFGGRMSWFRIGFEFGSTRYNILGSGGSSNLPMILQHSWGWQFSGPASRLDIEWMGKWLSSKLATDYKSGPQPYNPRRRNPPAGVIPQKSVALSEALMAMYVLLLIPAGYAAAKQARRDDPRALVAMLWPWIFCFALLPRMHDRYLVWAAAFSATMAGVGLGMTLLHVLLSVFSWSMMAQTMYDVNRGYDPAMNRLLHGTHPDMGWALLLIVAIVGYVALSKRKEKDEELALGPLARPG